MQQRIGFCATADGARIAYATVGAGPALIFAQWVSHLSLEWEEPRVRDFWETIGRRHMVVRYDKHGCGLSDRNRTDFSLDSEIRTIDAIVKELGLNSFVIWGQSGGSHSGDSLRGKVSRSCLAFDFVQSWYGLIGRRLGRRRESRHLSRAAAVELPDGLIVTGGGGAREFVRCRFAAMVLPHPARKRDRRNARSANHVLVERGRAGFVPQGQRANPGRPLPQQSDDGV